MQQLAKIPISALWRAQARTPACWLKSYFEGSLYKEHWMVGHIYLPQFSPYYKHGEYWHKMLEMCSIVRLVDFMKESLHQQSHCK